MPRVQRNNSKPPAGSLLTEVAQRRVMIGVAAIASRYLGSLSLIRSLILANWETHRDGALRISNPHCPYIGNQVVFEPFHRRGWSSVTIRPEAARRSWLTAYPSWGCLRLSDSSPQSEARCPRAGTNLYLVAVSQVHRLLAHGLVGFSTPAFDLDRDAVMGGDPILCRAAMPFLTVTCMPF